VSPIEMNHRYISPSNPKPKNFVESAYVGLSKVHKAPMSARSGAGSTIGKYKPPGYVEKGKPLGMGDNKLQFDRFNEQMETQSNVSKSRMSKGNTLANGSNTQRLPPIKTEKYFLSSKFRTPYGLDKIETQSVRSHRNGNIPARNYEKKEEKVVEAEKEK
jgi:hypothetical protein